MPRSLLFPSAQWLLALASLQLAVTSLADNGVPVAVREVTTQPIYRQVDITGTVTSPGVAQLSPAIAGLVATLRVDEGDHVAAGDLLLELDADLARLQWESAKAVQRQAAAALEDARRRLNEAQQLAPQRSIAQTVVLGLEAEVTQNSAALDRAAADAKYQQAVLARHQIKAPFAGVISSKLADQGEWVSQGQGVFELVATEDLRLDFAVAEDFLAALTLDAPVQFIVNALPDRHFQGRVKTIVPVSDPGARTFLLRVVPVDDSVALMPGMSVQAILQIPEQRSGLVVPRDATLRYPDGRVVVWVLEQGDDGPVARERRVRIGQAFDGVVEIREGLSGSAQVVVQGNEALRDGQRVQIVSKR